MNSPRKNNFGESAEEYGLYLIRFFINLDSPLVSYKFLAQEIVNDRLQEINDLIKDPNHEGVSDILFCFVKFWENVGEFIKNY